MGSILNIDNEAGEHICSLPVVDMRAEMCSKEPAIYTVVIPNDEVPKIYNHFLDVCDSILDNNIKNNNHRINMLELNIEKDRLRKKNIEEVRETLNNIYNTNNIY